MNIASEYNINDNVWFLYDNQVVQRRIAQIVFPIIFTFPADVLCKPIRYRFYKDLITASDFLLMKPLAYDYNVPIEIDEKHLFKTKEDLLKSL